MARSDGSIIIDTKIVDKGFRSGISGLRSGISGLAKFTAVGMAGMIAGIAAAGAAFSGLIKAGEASASANAGIVSVAESMGTFGKETGEVTDRIIDFAEEHARLTGVETNTIKETQAILLTFAALAESADEVGGAFDRTTKLAVDMASAGMGEASSNAIQLGKALQDPIGQMTALNRTGALTKDQQEAISEEFKRTGDIATAQESILEALEAQVGGHAEATADASDQIKVAFSQLTEGLGEKLLPVFGEAVEGLLGWLDEMSPALDMIGDGLAAIFAGDDAGFDQLADGIAIIGESLVEGIGRILPGLIRGLSQVLVTLAQAIPPLLPPIAEALIGGLLIMAEALPEILPPLLDALSNIIISVAEALPEMIPLLVEALADIFIAAVELLPTLLPLLVEAITTLLTSVMDQLPTILPILALALMDLLIALAETLPEAQVQFFEAFAVLIEELAEMLPDLLPELLEGLVELITLSAEALPLVLPAFIEAMTTIMEALADVLPEIVPPLAEAMVELAPVMVESLMTVMDELILAVIETAPDFIAAAVTLVAAITQTFAEQIVGAGASLVTGLWEGIDEKRQWLEDKVRGFAGGVVGGIKDFLGIHSPSKLLEREVGVNMALGIGAGLDSKLNGIMRGISATVSGEVTRFSGALAGGGGMSGAVSISVDARGATDPSAVRAQAQLGVEEALSRIVGSARLKARMIGDA